MYIHRHVGGLEIHSRCNSPVANIHRHVGGLEKLPGVCAHALDIHRHVGGLEIGWGAPRY